MTSIHLLSLISPTLFSSLSFRSINRSTLNPSSLKVTLTRAMSSSSNQRVFQLKLDPLTGNSEWVVIEENEEMPETSQSGLLATTSYLDMLNDSPRNRAYLLAIEKTVTKPCHVLDIGAGTGLLSMMAARAMRLSDTAKCPSTKGAVTACESYLPMVKLMRKVVHRNGMGKLIDIINKRSDELKVGVDIPSRADILVSEILDSELLGEGLIPTLQHAHDMLLVENPQSVPYRATTYCQLVESTFLWKLHDLYNNEAKASDGIHLVPDGLDTILRVKSQQHPMHCDAIADEIKLLSEPIKIFEFDFWKRPESNGEIQQRIKAIETGTIHAIVTWWVLQLDREGTIFYSTAPKWISSDGAREWCDHWKQCVWFVPGNGVSVSKDESILLKAVHTETSLSYDLKTNSKRPEETRHELSFKDLQLGLSPERIAIYGDSEWRISMSKSLKKALKGRFQPLCVVADDSVFLTLHLMQLSKESRVISLFPGLREMGGRYLEAVADSNGILKDRIEIFEKGRACLTLNDTQQKKVDVLIGEPYYYGNDGALPWLNLRFWRERTRLDAVLSEDATIMPCKGLLKACAVYVPDIWKSRCSLKEIEGFEHSVVNKTLGACGKLQVSQEGPCLPYSIWQCGKLKEVSKVFTVMEFDFSMPISPCSGKAQVEFVESAICHGFVLWIDWVMDADSSIVISTGPAERHWKQGVKLLSEPVSVGPHECCSTVFEASFDPSVDGDLVIRHTFS